MSGDGRESNEVQAETESVSAVFEDHTEPMLESDWARVVSEPGPEHVSNPSEAQIEPVPVFVESLGDPFNNLDRVEDFEKDVSDGSDIPIEII